MFLKYTLGNFSFDLKNISVALEYGTKHKVNNIILQKNEASDFILDDSNKRHFLWTFLRYKATEFRIPSWTGFQISVSNDIPLLKTTVGYLACINSSATEMSTIYQVWSS